MQERRTTTGRLRRLMRRTLLGLAALVLLLAAGGAIYNALALHRLREMYPPPGRMYAVNDQAMHLYCSGAGSPTVVLESGHAESFLVRGKVQPDLSRTTRVCSYDRAGLGWSEDVDGPRDADHIAAQLHGLLAKAGIGGPLVLMGHSGGGLYIRSFAARYPAQVAGLVFLDASTLETAPPPASVAALDHHGALAMDLFKAAIGLGIPRAMGACDTPPPGFDATANLWRADACKPDYVTAVAREQAAGPASRAEVQQAGGFGDLPVLVFSRDTRLPRPRALPAPSRRRTGSGRTRCTMPGRSSLRACPRTAGGSSPRAAATTSTSNARSWWCARWPISSSGSGKVATKPAQAPSRSSRTVRWAAVLGVATSIDGLRQTLDADHLHLADLALLRRVGLGHDGPAEAVGGRFLQAFLAVGHRPDFAGEANFAEGDGLVWQRTVAQ